MSSVAIVDYGMGNLHSIAKALQSADARTTVTVSADANTILAADRVVFPGVGAMRDCMQALRTLGLDEVLHTVARTKPLLGICLGMQALLTESAENDQVACLDIVKGQVVRFAADLQDPLGQTLKIPHMGWNQVHYQSHPLWHNIQQDSRFYFVHSYYVQPQAAGVTIATTQYPEAFTCALAQENVFAVQFHPEKSQVVGLQLLQNFLHWDGLV